MSAGCSHLGRPVEHNLGLLFLKLSCFIDVTPFFLCLERRLGFCFVPCNRLLPFACLVWLVI